VQPKFDGICSTDIWVLRAKEGFSQDFLLPVTITIALAQKEFYSLKENKTVYLICTE